MPGSLRKLPSSKAKVSDHTVDGYRFVNLASLQRHVSDISLHAATCEKARNVAIFGGTDLYRRFQHLD